MDLESVLKTGIEAYDENSHKFKQFLNAVRDFFQLEPPSIMQLPLLYTQ